MALTKLNRPIVPYNMDRTKNKAEAIEHSTWLKIQMEDKLMNVQLLVTDLGKETVILRLPWLQQYNPTIDWTKRTLDLTNIKPQSTFQEVLQQKIDLRRASITTEALQPTIEEIFEDLELFSNKELLPLDGPILLQIYNEEEEDDNEDEINLLRAYLGKNDEEEIYPEMDEEEVEINKIRIWVKKSISQELAHNSSTERPKVILSEAYAEYKDVFNKKASQWLPEWRTWDHTIDLKPDFIPKDCKVYPMTPEGQIKLDEFLTKNLCKKYIWLSKSSMASPFFFVSKKDSNKLRPCQDYPWLNEGTIKNVYPLPRIGDLLDKLKGAKFFTKLDLRWGYNNVRIQKGDEWKAAFKTNQGLFEPLVMFFGLCNSLATFQNMMNDIFRDEINEGWILIYMDDILIFAKDKDK